MLRARQKLGKYRIIGRLSKGPLADVYQAFDTIHKSRVALKIPRSDSVVDHEDFLREAQVATRLQHPNILTVQNASYIGDYFVIVMPLGEESLADRLERRLSLTVALEFASQALAGLAHAHNHRVIHCDIKPENFIIFPGNHLRLTDFGFAKISYRTVKASGSGTIDYIAPEQAMGRPMFQSDVFSLGLVLYKLFSGKLPHWPYDWPPVGHDRLVSRVRPELVEVLRRAMEMKPADRYRDAAQMQAAFERLKSRARRQRTAATRKNQRSSPAWRQVQWREFQRQFKSRLDTRQHCRRCEGPVSETMQACPWCGFDNPARGAETAMPAHCPRCERGVKLDWNYCAWCYGPGFEAESERRYPDKRYTEKCANKRCKEPLMPFMRYCPWCRSKVKRPWRIAGSNKRCRACESGIVKEFWNFCAWCREPVER